MDASENFDVVSFEFERGFFEFDAFAWGDAEDEAEVDVHDVAFGVHEDVAVVSVFDLKDISN